MNETERDPTDGATARNQPIEGRCGAAKRDGDPCRKQPMRGTNRCRLHGGASPQAQRRARERIRDAADHAAAALIGFMENADVPWPTRLAAARDLLDRADVTGKTVVEVEMRPWEILLSGISSERPSGRAPEIDAAAQAEIDGYNREETERGGEIVDAELVEDEPPIAQDDNALDLPDNVTLLRATVGPNGTPPPPPLQTHEERYGDPDLSPGRKRPRGKRRPGPRDGR